MGGNLRKVQIPYFLRRCGWIYIAGFYRVPALQKPRFITLHSEFNGEYHVKGQGMPISHARFGIVSIIRGNDLIQRLPQSSNNPPHFSWQATLDTGAFLAYAHC